jgi:hypothetical protein
MHGEADRTPGGLTASDLKYSSDGRIISKKQSEAAKANPGLKMWRDSVAEAKKKLKPGTLLETPWKDLTAAQKKIWLNGTGLDEIKMAWKRAKDDLQKSGEGDIRDDYVWMQHKSMDFDAG